MLKSAKEKRWHPPEKGRVPSTRKSNESYSYFIFDQGGYDELGEYGLGGWNNNSPRYSFRQSGPLRTGRWVTVKCSEK